MLLDGDVLWQPADVCFRSRWRRLRRVIGSWDELEEGELRALAGKFWDAGSDLWHNFVAIFTACTMDWSRLAISSRDVFYPYLIGGILPGSSCATIGYYFAVPVMRAYQNAA